MRGTRTLYNYKCAVHALYIIINARNIVFIYFILLTKTIAAQNEDALSYYKVRRLYFLAVVFVRSIIL